MLKIQISNPDVSGGSIPITWCLDVELIHELAKANVKDPQIVIVVAPADPARYSPEGEYRKVVSLKDMVAYIDFHRPGKLNIWAFVSFASKKNAKESFLERHVRTYQSTLLNSDGTDWSSYRECYSNLPVGRFSAPVLVEVPDGVFAKEPPKWEQNWTNHFFNTMPVDQCAYRRRRMFSYTLQPLIMLGNIFLRFSLLLLGLLIAARGITLKFILHPLQHSLYDSLDTILGGSFLIRKLPDLEELRNNASVKDFATFLSKKLCFVPFMPIVIGLIGFLAWHHLLFSTVLVVIAILVIIGLMLTMMMIAWNYDGIRGFFNKSLDKIFNSKAWYENKSEIDLLSCNGPVKTFSSLPFKKKSIKLVYLDTKSKVCRPFAK